MCFSSSKPNPQYSTQHPNVVYVAQPNYQVPPQKKKKWYKKKRYWWIAPMASGGGGGGGC